MSIVTQMALIRRRITQYSKQENTFQECRSSPRGARNPQLPQTWHGCILLASECWLDNCKSQLLLSRVLLIYTFTLFISGLRFILVLAQNWHKAIHATAEGAAVEVSSGNTKAGGATSFQWSPWACDKPRGGGITRYITKKHFTWITAQFQFLNWL